MSGNIPFGILLPQQTQEPTNLNPIDRDTPARIRIALELLHSFTCKQLPRPAVSDSMIEIMDGMILTEREKVVQNASLNLLLEYLSGKMDLNPWEMERMRQEKSKEKQGTILACLACSHKSLPDSSCRVCKGRGVILALPVSEGY